LIFAYLTLALIVVYRVMRWRQFNVAIADS
jgi:hypothetical protein